VLIVLMCVYRKAIFKKVNDFIHRQQKNAPIVVKPQNKVMRFFAKVAFMLIVRTKIIFRLKKTVKIKGPAIVLCNHGSWFDFMYACVSLPEIRPQFMAARLFFYHKWLGWLIRNLGAYPKSMFSKDIETVKNSMRILQRKGVIVMMPEARLCTTGRFEDIQDTTLSSLRK
jgi:1-acyl-sn-glycerol-3-phosphate acyltransferase